MFTFIFFFLAVFLQAGAYGLTFLLPRLFERFGADEKAVGVTLIIAARSTLIAVYYAGHLSDWFGRMMTLVGACLSIASAMALFSTMTSKGAMPIVASLFLGADELLKAIRKVRRDTQRLQSTGVPKHKIQMTHEEVAMTTTVGGIADYSETDALLDAVSVVHDGKILLREHFNEYKSTRDVALKSLDMHTKNLHKFS